MPDTTLKLRKEPRLDAKREAFDYQQEAVDFVAGRDYAAIFHEQGLGKSKIAVDVILRWLSTGQVDTALVITKKSLIANWIRELQLHSHLKPMVLSANSRANYLTFTTGCRLVLAHYEVAKKEERRLLTWMTTRRVGVILDEAAKLKNPAAALTQVYHRLAPTFARRVIMTGTPVANRPYDVWSEIFFLDQGKLLGSDFETFKKEHDFDETYADDPAAYQAWQQRLTDVAAKLRSISMRETKAGGRISLPAKEFVRVTTEFETEQAALYQQIKEELRLVVFRNGSIVEEPQEGILKRLLRLVQVASNPKLVDEGYHARPGKLDPLLDLVQDIVSHDEKAIVWTSFTDNADWLAKQLAAFGALSLHGKHAMERRNQVVTWFLGDPSAKVLVATPGAAKEGLTLTVANHVIFYDRTYSLDDYLQAQDRIHRISQTKTCYVYNLVMADSVDEWIAALLEDKRLAALLAQGDISQDAYQAQATLSFFSILKSVLGFSLDETA